MYLITHDVVQTDPCAFARDTPTDINDGGGVVEGVTVLVGVCDAVNVGVAVKFIVTVGVFVFVTDGVGDGVLVNVGVGDCDIPGHCVFEGVYVGEFDGVKLIVGEGEYVTEGVTGKLILINIQIMLNIQLHRK